MRHVILGTAGHIDHGKSSLVKALTGTNPDRLKEEQERGITIDLGFANLGFPDGLQIGIVDVPGHERLVRNMLAGAGGIDMVLMVIAADEGIMPQSREHLHICNLLRIKTGLVVLTKLDLVEREWLELVTEEARDFVKGSFLDGAQIVPVSSSTGENLDLLKEKIHALALTVAPKPTKGLFRLPVDRVFTLKGFGTVVTGTAVSGTMALDEQVEILPRGIQTKVRGLHTHGTAAQKVHAGQRVAINLQGIEKEELERGDTVVTAGRFAPTNALDATIELLPQAPELKNRELVHFHLGTSETVARVVLYGGLTSLKAGQNAYCQLRLQGQVIAQSGDRYIIRRFSPLETTGGGEVLDPSPLRRKIKDGIDDLEVFAHGSIEQKIAQKIRKAALKGMARTELEGWLGAEIPIIRDAIGALKGKGTIIKIEEVLLHSQAFEAFKAQATGLLSEFHRHNPLKHGMPKEELRAKLDVPLRVFSALLPMVQEAAVEKDLLRLKSFSPALSDGDRERIVDVFKRNGFNPPAPEEIALEFKQPQGQIEDSLRLLDKEGKLKRLNDATYLSIETYERMLELLKGHFAKQPQMSVAEFRDLLGTTRKYALPFLEYLDANRYTVRVGDVRKWLPKD